MSSGWKIPENALRPNDERKNKNQKIEKPIDRAYLYLNPTYCDSKRENQYTKYDKEFCEITNTYLCGNIEKAEEEINDFIKNCDKDYLPISFILLRLIYQDLGKIKELRKCERKIIKLKRQNDYPYTNLLVNLLFHNKIKPIDSDVPKEYLPLLYYVETLYDAILKAEKLESVDSISTSLCELSTSLLEAFNTPALCVYYHCLLADFYTIFDDKNAIMRHKIKAYEIAKEYNWYFMLSQYSFMLDWSFLIDTDLEAYYEIEKYSEKLILNYMKAGIFSNIFINYETHDVNIIKVLFMIAQRKKIKEIEKALDITTYRARKYIDEVHKITGLESKEEIKNLVISVMKNI